MEDLLSEVDNYHAQIKGHLFLLHFVGHNEEKEHATKE